MSAPDGDRKRILFVDDEPVLLEALRDAMRVYRRRWQVEFAPSGEAALELLAAQPVEVVIAFHELEQQQNGVTHAATGAYLLSLWGLPDGVVEAVAHHHDPEAVPGDKLDAVAAVHIADALANESRPDGSERPPAGALDDALLERLGVAPQQHRWRKLAMLWAGQETPPARAASTV